jgi:hypothetical protein
VTSDQDDGAAEFLVAAPGQLDGVLAVLDEAAAWLRSREVVQWPSRFEPSWVQSAERAGNGNYVLLAFLAGHGVSADLSESIG